MPVDSDSSSDSATGERRAYRIMQVVLRLIIVAGLVTSIYEQQWLNVTVIGCILFLTVLPALIFRHLEIYIPPEFEFVTVAFIFGALFLGETRGFYGSIWWWDIALHVTSGVLLGILGFLLVHVLNGIRRLDLHMQPGFVALFAFCFALAVGAIWEVFEFAMDTLAGTNMQKPFRGDPSGLTDTMWDLIVDALGALATTLSAYLYMKSGMRSAIGHRIRQFIARNPQLFRGT